MILTQVQIEEVLSIIDNYAGIFISHNISPNYLSEAQKKQLLNSGIDISKIPTNLNSINQAYKLGMLSDMLGDQATRLLTYNQFITRLKQGKALPITSFEKNAIASLERQMFNDTNKLFNNIKSEVSNQLVFADKKLNTVHHSKEVISASKEALARRKGVQYVASELGHLTGKWNRDLSRIADYVLHTAFDEGRAAQFKKYGPQVLVYKIPYPQACRHCVRLYLTAGIGSQPRLFTIPELEANGTNVGRTVNNWKATIGPVHPHCFDKETDVLTDSGWKSWVDVTGGEKFLSVNPIDGKSEWVDAIRLVKYKYKGKMHKFKGHAFDLMTTPNHRHFIRSRKSKNYFGRLVSGEDLVNYSEFVNISPNSWEGFSPKIKNIGGLDVSFNTYCKFMGWYLSEGSSFKVKNRNLYVVDITQHKDYNIEEIKELFIEIFGKHSRCSVGHIGNYVKKDICDFFIQFGHACKKYIPKDIMNASKESIEIFMNAFRKGDGSKRVKSNKYIPNSKNIISYTTSSEKMSSQLGELIIKMDYRPSYFYQHPKPIKFKNGVYTSKKTQHIIYQNRSKTSLLKRMDFLEVDYDDFVYDVELEKFHTLYVRRNGKVTISGNCRCTLLKAPILMNKIDLANGIWEFNGEKFVKVKRVTKTNSTVKVTVNGKTTEVKI